MSDLFLENVISPAGEPISILVRGGRIEAIGSALERPDGVERHDGKGRTVLPGAIDMHVHFRTPGGEHKETLLTGSASAAKGGVTTCGDMPNTSPPTITLKALEQKRLLAAGSPINLYYNFGATPDNLDQVREAFQCEDVVAIKIYMGPSTGVGGLAPDAVEAHFRQAAEIHLPVMVHAEDVEIINSNQARFPHDARNHGRLRSLEAELSAVELALALAKKYGVRLYLTHSTSARVLDLVDQSGLGDKALVEVCPHHLSLHTDLILPPVENRFKVNPPVRDEDQQSALFQALPGRIGCLGSDHAPHTMEEKMAPYDKAPSGMPGVEYLLPMALTWWNRGVISTDRLIELTSRNVARFFGLNKGVLQPGYDADLVLINPTVRWKVGEGEDRITSKCGWSPYLGLEMTGRPEMTIVSGKVVYQHD